jgi:hypothetical protein
MTGSFWVAIVTPIVALTALGCWLGMVYWAAAHPEWKTHPAAQGPELTAAGFLPGPAEAGEQESSEAARPPLHRAAA